MKSSIMLIGREKEQSQVKARELTKTNNETKGGDWPTIQTVS